MKKRLIIVRNLELTDSQHTYNELLQICLKEKGYDLYEIRTGHGDTRQGMVELIQRKKENYIEILLFSINFTYPFFVASLDAGVPYIIWNEIHPRDMTFNGVPEDNRIFCFDGSKRVAGKLNKNGIKAFFLPIGYDQRFFAPSTHKRRVHDCSFVGNNLTYYMEEYRKLIFNKLSEAYPAERLGSRKKQIADILNSSLHYIFDEMTYEELDLNDHEFNYIMEQCLNKFCRNIESAAMLNTVKAFFDDSGLKDSILGTFAQKQRLQFFAKILDTTADFALFGQGWENTPFATNCNGSYPYKKLATLYSQSRINLHIHRCNMDGINDRIFNVTASGEFLLTTYVDGLEELFDLENEVVTYRCLEEFTDKLKFYLANDSARERIAVAGYNRCSACYRFDNMLDHILDFTKKIG